MQHVQQTSPVQSRLEALLTVFELHDELADACQQIREKQQDFAKPSELLVFVFGEGNFGKSSLINCLLGREVAKVSFLPETWRVDMFRRVPRSEDEFALVRKAGGQAMEKMSIAEAQMECSAQAAEAKSALKSSANVVAKPGQIIEIQWHFCGLDLADNIVLVDTPGFSQYRDGLKEARAELLSTQTGVAYDVQEVYESFFHRANVVLWAFKASKLHDRDTLEAFDTLSKRGKQILGVVTYTDTVPVEQRPELMQKVKDLFGHGVSEFIPVISGGKSPERGLGIPNLRHCIASLSQNASSIKIQEFESFIEVQARFGKQWLQDLGDTLVHNVSRLSLFCNAASEVLLREAKKHHDSMLEQHRRMKQLSAGLDAHVAAGLAQIMRDMRWAVFGRQQKQQTAVQNFRNGVSIYFDVDGLNAARHSALQRIANIVTAEAKRIATSYEVKQRLIEAGGRSQERRLESWITPPDTAAINIAVSDFTVPVPSNDFFDVLLTLIFGGEPSPQQVQSTQLAARQAVSRLMQDMLPFVPNYTKEVAKAILKSVDIAVGKLYPNNTLEMLRDQADSIDRDIQCLSQMVPTPANAPDHQYRYGTRYRIWSPRDDTRKAAIDLFCEWFAPRQAQLRIEAAQWLESSHVQSLLAAEVRRCCDDYFQQTNPYVVFATGAPERLEADKLALLSISNYESIKRWLDPVDKELRNRRLFEDSVLAKGLLDDFDYIRLTGIAADFTAELVGGFVPHFEKELRNVTFPITKYVFDDELEARLRARPPVRDRSLVLASATGATAAMPVGGLTYLLPVHLLPQIAPLMQAVCVGVAGAAILAPSVFAGSKLLLHRSNRRTQRQITALWEKEKEQRKQSCIGRHLETLPHQIASYVAGTSQRAWMANLSTLNTSLAAQLAGKRTLIQKKPLDYAMEGDLTYIPGAITS